ncbi:AAA family ATPase [Streptomyces sp. NPDC053048]|uniref:AAA family ATPase n=1 Tax=Streptomyces sp. NPDC053048 TaxID=3365694 RepID=UPI0037D04293
MRTRTDVPGVPSAPEERAGGVRDLRGGRGTPELRYPRGDLLVVSGLPGSGKSTLMRRVVATTDGRGAPVHRVDSQDARERLERRLPRRVPYAVYRPFARLAHYAALGRALRSDASVVVHDCGQRSVVRRWLAREARRRGGAVHVVLLAVDPAVALAGQAARGRGVTAYAFTGHLRAMTRLERDAVAGRLPVGVASVTILDRRAADALRVIGFG